MTLDRLRNETDNALPGGMACIHGKRLAAECCAEQDYIHRNEPGCWCRPNKTYTDLVTGTQVWVHRYADD